MRKYFSDDAWERAKVFYDDWPTESWIALCRDITAALTDGTATARADEFLQRWNALALSFWEQQPIDLALSRQLHEGFARAWRDHENWPSIVKRRFDDHQIDAVAAFIGGVSRDVARRARKSVA